MDRVLIVPAAGRGTRLGGAQPKALVPVAGRPMLDHVLQLHARTADRAVVVVAPACITMFEHYQGSDRPPVDLVVQPEPTGMLDAILAAAPVVARDRPRRVGITWCDQIALSPETVWRVAQRALGPDEPALVFATLAVDNPYVHFDRNERAQIVAVRQQREGDEMPARGETDMGLFDLSLEAYLSVLPAFATSAAPAPGTGERNFLPFIPWLASRQRVETVPGVSLIETVGINTPEERDAVEAHIARRDPS
jgi:bifunctional UDP-N-acetylglucosamine pyrophosphorylase / glucosamine-1-phosphate N-acetyltransferase